MIRQNTRHSLSVQIASSLLLVLATVILSLIMVGHNAISVADVTAGERQQRFAERHLAAAIARMPDEQRSATIWDDAVQRTKIRDHAWIDTNLGAWMQDYFGHNESYILDASNLPVFASVAKQQLSPDAYTTRADSVDPLVQQLRSAMEKVSEDLADAHEALADISVVSPVQFETGMAIVSVVPIIPDTGRVAQLPGTEQLHIAVRYIDAGFAQEIGQHIELKNVAFQNSPAAKGQLGIPVTDQAGNAIAWLTWEPERPGVQLLMTMLPVLLASGIAIGLLLWWFIRRLMRVSRQLQLSEARLQQSQKLEAVGQLTGGIAHDFNNLLTIIMGSTEMIQDKLCPEHPAQRYAAINAKAADRAAELTGRLLAFSRKQALTPQVIDVNVVVCGMEEMLRRTLSEDIDIKIAPCANLWRTEVDIGQVEAALLNLAINSRDAMPSGGALTIETANVVLDSCYVASEPGLAVGEFIMIAVSDTGHGIPKNQIDRVFEPFFTTKAVGKGTGLGLSMVYGFAKQTGGHIRVYSELGEGTTVKLYFPRYDGGAPVPKVTHCDSHLAHGRETVLIVEDDSLILQQLAAQLTSLDYEVLAAPSGAPALAILKERPDISLMLTDVVLPGGMNGQQVADAARVICPGLKVLFTSGYSESAIMHHGRLDPGVELLSKPYRRSELAAKMRKVLDSVSMH